MSIQLKKVWVKEKNNGKSDDEGHWFVDSYEL